jgi:hypothetical protein
MTDQMNRRRALGLGAAVATVGLGAAAGALPGGVARADAQHAEDFAVQAQCVNPDNLARHSAVGAARSIYEGTGDPSTLVINEAFFQQLYNWRNFWQANCPWPWTTELWNYGAYNRRDGACTSWHEAGRAIDITALKDDADARRARRRRESRRRRRRESADECGRTRQPRHRSVPGVEGCRYPRAHHVRQSDRERTG